MIIQLLDRKREISTYWAISSITFTWLNLSPQQHFKDVIHSILQVEKLCFQEVRSPALDNSLSMVKSGSRHSPGHHLPQYQESRALTLKLIFTLHCYLTFLTCTFPPIILGHLTCSTWGSVWITWTCFVDCVIIWIWDNA